MPKIYCFPFIPVYRKTHHNKVKPWDMPRKNYFYKYDLHDGAEDNDSWREENTATLMWNELCKRVERPARGGRTLCHIQQDLYLT